MTVDKLPKILFIADEIPQSIHAGSIQFLRLFEGYPTEKLIVIGKKPDPRAEILNCKYYTLSFDLYDRLQRTRFATYISNFYSLGKFLPKLPKDIEKIALEFKPDIVVSLMQRLPYYHAAYHFSKNYKIPFVIFCHDDADDIITTHRFFKPWLMRLNGIIYRYAVRRICISPEMAEAFEKKYLAKGEFVYPLASKKIKSRPIEKSTKLVNETYLTVGYAGSLAYGYKEGINEIVTCLENTNTLLKIYRNQESGIKKSENIEFSGYSTTAEETWLKIIEECDAVILPYSFEEKFERLYRTHFPSKLTEYINLNMPVIIFGPEYANGVQFGLKNPTSFATCTSLKLLKSSLEAMKFPHKRLKYSEESLELQKKHFSNSKVF